MTHALPADAALLLDMDGTLIDIAPTPDAVIVPPSLPGILAILRDRLGGALAIVTGRPVHQIEALLPGIPTAIAGEHGGAIRHGPGAGLERAALASAPAEWLAQAERVVQSHPGTLVERKAHGFVLHYRLAPASGPALHDALRDMLAGDTRFTILPALMAWELKPVGTDKATAVAAIMARPPFLGRVPIYIGDDVTDEDGMRAARALGGLGWRVPDEFGNAAGVRAWLELQAA